MGKKKIINTDYIEFLDEVKSEISQARVKAIRSVNKELIGKLIVERQKKYGWGKGIVERLSRDLKKAFNSSVGYSIQNLWYMRQFYLEYKGQTKLQQLVGVLFVNGADF